MEQVSKKKYATGILSGHRRQGFLAHEAGTADVGEISGKYAPIVDLIERDPCLIRGAPGERKEIAAANAGAEVDEFFVDPVGHQIAVAAFLHDRVVHISLADDIDGLRLVMSREVGFPFSHGDTLAHDQQSVI